MKCLILAAGYATRLYPLTENFPKPLLKVKGKTILDLLVDDIASSGAVEEYVVISNHKFARHFEEWAGTKALKITVVDDGTTSNETRLGAVRDMQLAIEQLNIDDDLLIIAGDNVLDFSLGEFLDYAAQKGTSCVMRYAEADSARLKKSGVAEVDETDLMLCMQEKPAQPKSCWCTPPFYFYKKEDVRLIACALEEGCGADAPGSFAAWLCARRPVHSMVMPGRRYDIGNLQSYEEVQQNYRGIRQIEGMDHLAIIAGRRQPTVEFYERLGFVEEESFVRPERGDEVIFMTQAGIRLEIFVSSGNPARVSAPEAYGLRHLALKVKNAARLRRVLLQAGYCPEELRTDAFNGRAMFFVKDPDGLPVEIHE